MKIKHSNLRWYALRWDFNTKKVNNYNVLENIAVDLSKAVKEKSVHDKITLKEYLKRKLMYYYWSKTECEFYVSGLHGNEYEKVDIWKQLEPNLDIITEYVNIKMELNLE